MNYKKIKYCIYTHIIQFIILHAMKFIIPFLMEFIHVECLVSRKNLYNLLNLLAKSNKKF